MYGILNSSSLQSSTLPGLPHQINRNYDWQAMERRVVSSWMWVGGGSADKSHHSGQLHKEGVGSVRPEEFSGGAECCKPWFFFFIFFFFPWTAQTGKAAGKKKGTGTLMCPLISVLLSEVGLFFSVCVHSSTGELRTCCANVQEYTCFRSRKVLFPHCQSEWNLFRKWTITVSEEYLPLFFFSNYLLCLLRLNRSPHNACNCVVLKLSVKHVQPFLRQIHFSITCAKSNFL